MNRDEVKARTKDFAHRAMKVVDCIEESNKGKVMAHQLMRSATAVGANYRAACRARSPKEFVAKFGIVLEEADETAFWIELLIEGGLLPEERLQSLHQEAEELCAITFSSIRSSRNKRLYPLS